MNEEQLREHYNIYTECWKLLRKYSNPTSDDAFWDELVKEANYLSEEHGNSEFAKRIIVDTLDEIDRILRGKEQEK